MVFERRKFARDHQQGARFRHDAPVVCSFCKDPGRSGPDLTSCWPGRGAGRRLGQARRASSPRMRLIAPAIFVDRLAVLSRPLSPSRTASTAGPACPAADDRPAAGIGLEEDQPKFRYRRRAWCGWASRTGSRCDSRQQFGVAHRAGQGDAVCGAGGVGDGPAVPPAEAHRR